MNATLNKSFSMMVLVKTVQCILDHKMRGRHVLPTYVMNGRKFFPMVSVSNVPSIKELSQVEECVLVTYVQKLKSFKCRARVRTALLLKEHRAMTKKYVVLISAM